MVINYACIWDKKDKIKTWSGTTFSLYKALQNKYNVIDRGFTVSKFTQNISKLCNIHIENKKLTHKGIYNKFLNRYYQNKIKKIKLNEDETIIEVFDLGTHKDKNFYIYQDLSIDFLIDCKKNKKDLFKYSGFQMFSKEDLEKRSKYQIQIYNDAKGIFTMSKFLQKHIIEYTGIPKEKVHYIGAGINLEEKYIKNINKEKNKILFVGRDFYRKGGDLVCKAFKILRKKYMPNAELYIVGPQKSLGDQYYDEKIFFEGDLSKEELSTLFNKCDIFCMPSRFEAYGIAFIEALVYGLPCIARNDYAMKEMIQNGKNGVLIDNDDEEELAKEMYKLLNNEEIQLNVKQNRKEYLSEYSWSNVVERIKRVIDADMKKKG